MMRRVDQTIPRPALVIPCVDGPAVLQRVKRRLASLWMCQPILDTFGAVGEVYYCTEGCGTGTHEEEAHQHHGPRSYVAVPTQRV